MRKLIALFIIALVAVLTSAGCQNPAIYVYGPQFPGGVGDVYFQNGEGVTLRVVGDPGDNDYFLRRWETTIYPGMYSRVTPDIGPHKFTVLRLDASAGWLKIYEVPVDVSTQGCYSYLLYRNGSTPTRCP